MTEQKMTRRGLLKAGAGAAGAVALPWIIPASALGRDGHVAPSNRVTMAFIGVYLDKASSNADAVRELKKIPEVLECHYTTGNWSILIKIICKDNEHLMQLLNKKIQPIDGVSRTETFISLEQQIERQIQL